MHANEVAAVKLVADAAGDAAGPLRAAVDQNPHAVRVIHIGHEVLGAFLLTDMPGHVEELSCLTLTDEGAGSGAEPLVLDYVVKAARFSRKKAIEVVAPPDSAEAVHLGALGFVDAGEAGAGRQRYRLTLKKK